MGATIFRHTLRLHIYHIVIPSLKCCILNPLSKNISVYHLTINNLSSCFFFFLSSPKAGREKEKTTAESDQALTTLASYKHPSQSIRHKCIAIRLASPTIAFLPLPELCTNRLYI